MTAKVRGSRIWRRRLNGVPTDTHMLGQTMSVVARVVMFVALLVAGTCSLAAARIESAIGDVRTGISAREATAAAKNQDVREGSVVLTGPKSLATLRFQDGQTVALDENTEFRIREYSFSKSEPTKNRSTQELVTGTLRVASRRVVDQTLRKSYRLITPTVILGIRGTDFIVAVVNPVFFSVLSGTITVSNSAGTSVFGAGAVGTVPIDTARAIAIARDALPPGILDAFSRLAALKLGAGITSTQKAATNDIPIQELAASIQAEKNKDTPLALIVANALEAGVASSRLTVAMLLAGVDPAMAIGALISSGADAAAVIDAALTVGVDKAVVSAAAIAAGISPDLTASVIAGLSKARSEATLGTSSKSTGGGGGRLASPN